MNYMEVYNKEFKISNQHKAINKFRKKCMNKLRISTEIEISEKNETEILELKNAIRELKMFLHGLNIRLKKKVSTNSNTCHLKLFHQKNKKETEQRRTRKATGSFCLSFKRKRERKIDGKLI
jgi:hypothetical protein